MNGEEFPHLRPQGELDMKKNGERAERTMTILLILIFAVGLSLLLYPTVSDWWNSFHATQAIASYDAAVAEANDDAYQEIWDSAVAYNIKVAQSGVNFNITPGSRAEYDSLLDISGNGMMGYIEIPKINCKLPVYHGTSESVLQVAVGHIEGSSLPVGGESTHCILSGHRGLPSARLFTDLDQMEEGDYFVLHILNETLTYEVDQIRIVLPDELDDLQIVEGQDLCTLVTCTPYGINTHRLLVRGHRIDNLTEVFVSMDATQVDPLIVASVVGAIILVVLFVWMLLSTRKKMRKTRGDCG